MEFPQLNAAHGKAEGNSDIRLQDLPLDVRQNEKDFFFKQSGISCSLRCF